MKGRIQARGREFGALSLPVGMNPATRRRAFLYGDRRSDFRPARSGAIPGEMRREGSFTRNGEAGAEGERWSEDAGGGAEAIDFPSEERKSSRQRV